MKIVQNGCMRTALFASFLTATLTLGAFTSSGCLLFANVDDGGTNEPERVEPEAGPAVVEPEPGPRTDGGEPEPIDDGGEPDAGVFEPDDAGTNGHDDAGSLDAGVVDAGEDGGPLDAGPPPRTLQDCRPMISAWVDGLPEDCQRYLGTFAVTPQLVTTREADSRRLRLHGRYLPGDVVTISGEGGNTFSASAPASESGAFVDITLQEGASYIGAVRVQGTVSYGQAWVHIRAHQLGGFFAQPELPQTTNGSRLGDLSPTIASVVEVQPFLTDQGQVCGVSPLGALACAHTDVDGAVRESQLDAGPPLWTGTRPGVAIVSAAGRVFAAGGNGAGGELDDVTSARVGVTGQLVDIRAEPSLQLARSHASAVVVGDSLCIVGGRSADDSLSSVECAEITPDGLEPFVVAGDLAQARFDAHAAVVGDRLLVVGGYTATNTLAEPDSESAQADPRDLVFDRSEDLPNVGRARAATVVMNDRLFLAGGSLATSTTLGTAVVQVGVDAVGTPVRLDFDSGVLPEATVGAKAVVTGNYIYLTPGESSSGTPTSPVVFTLLTSSTLETFERETTGPAFDRAFGAGVVVGNSFYVVGGVLDDGSSTPAPHVIRAELTPSGQIARVSEQENLLQTGRSHACAIVLYDRVFILGGRERVDENTVRPTSILSATVSADGSLSTFNAIPNVLPGGREGPRCHVLGGNVFLLGGRTDGANEAEFRILSADAASLLSATDGNSTVLFQVVDGTLGQAPRWMHTTRVFDRDNIRVFAGIPQSGVMADMNVFDVLGLGPVTVGSSNPSNAAYTPAIQESASVLPFSDSEVIVGGGYNYLDTTGGAHTVLGSFGSGENYPLLQLARRGHVSALVGPSIVTLTGRGATPSSGLLQEATTIVGP